MSYRKRARFPRLQVGREASGTCALASSAKFADLRRRRTRLAHATRQDGGAQRPCVRHVLLTIRVTLLADCLQKAAKACL